MFSKAFDFVSIGDITNDAFIRLKDAEVHCNVRREESELCMPFGSKIPFEYVKIIRATGNAANAAVSASRLGVSSALVSNVGNDDNGRQCRVELNKQKVDTTLVKTNSDRATNYHFVLWFDSDRTILVNHIGYNYKLPILPKTKWIYLTSIATDTHHYHMEIADYLDKNRDVKLAFQPGTYQIKLGFNEIKRLYARTEVLIVNLEEAERILNMHAEIKKLQQGLALLGPKLVIITDGPNGAYLHDGDHYYFMPIYHDSRPAFERTGCGDAFASTFISALIKGKTPLEALMWAPINPMSVAQFIGAQEGLLTLEQMEWWLKRAPEDYKPREI